MNVGDGVGIPGIRANRLPRGDARKAITHLHDAGHRRGESWPPPFQRLVRLPIFEAQVGDARELPNVVRDEDGVVGASRGCDQEVVRPDRRSRAIELLAKEAILLGAAVVEGKARDRVEESLQQAQILRDPAGPPRTIEKLGFDDRGEPNKRAWYASQAIGQ